MYQGFQAHIKELKARDIVIKIGKQSLENMELEQFSEMLKGPKDLALDLEILSQGW